MVRQDTWGGGQKRLDKPDCLFQSMKEPILSNHPRGGPKRHVNGYHQTTAGVKGKGLADCGVAGLPDSANLAAT